MLALFWFQVVLTNNNESSAKEKEKHIYFLLQTSKRYVSLSRKQKKLVNKIHKELKLNVDCHIKTCKNHNFQV
jgi:hypothetical protein